MSKWFIDHRQDFIADCLRIFGQVNRATLVERFDISAPQASLDIQRFLRERPDAMVYDGRVKTYVVNAVALGNADVETRRATAPEGPPDVSDEVPGTPSNSSPRRDHP